MKHYTIVTLITFTLLSAACKAKKDPEVNPGPELYKTADLSAAVYTTGIEGPYYYKGAVLAVGYQHNGTIGSTKLDGSSSLFVDLPSGSIGNGIDMDPQGRLMVADYAGHNVLMIDTATKVVSVYAHQATNMDQPNDVVAHHLGYLYCSDPNWSNNTGKIWRVDAPGTFVLLESSMGTTNGITLSPDDKTLYVNESVQRTLYAYDVADDGTVSNKRLLHQFTDFGMDGMKCDKAGNIYIARYGAGVIAVVSPTTGEVIREIPLTGEKPTNVCFGGADGKTCFVTLQDRGVIEYFYVETAGKGW